MAFASGLYSCKLDPDKQLKREWYVIEYHTPLFNTGDKGPASIFRFYPNGKYCQFGSGGYSFGAWLFDKPTRVIHLKPTGSSVELLDSYYYVDVMTPNMMQLRLFRNPSMRPGTEELEYTLKAGGQSEGSEDPYDPAMHLWRLKPGNPESDEMICSRVRAYLSFLKTLYRHAIDNKFDILRNDWFPHPIRMHYGNGVRLAYSDELDDWNTCFYDSAQAVKGYQCISGPFQNVTLKKTGNRLERNLDVVEQVLKGMK